MSQPGEPSTSSATAGSRLRRRRRENGWTQAELARRAGLSRAAVSAVETGRVVPSVAAALSLARALHLAVEELWSENAEEPVWAWSPRPADGRYWLAELGGRLVRYPVEQTAAGVLPHDGVAEDGAPRPPAGLDPRRTLAIAGCDPAAGLLAETLLRRSGVRLLPFGRSSRRALELLRDGQVAVAGVHLGRGEANRSAARKMLGKGCRLIRVASWEEGVALAPGLGIRSAAGIRGGRLRWIAREAGSGARACLDELLEDRAALGASVPCASDHRGVAEAIRAGWAEAGVCVRLVAAEAGLDFLPVRREAYDLCYPARLEDDPRIVALVEGIRSRGFRRALGDLPGYEVRDAGESAAPEEV